MQKLNLTNCGSKNDADFIKNGKKSHIEQTKILLKIRCIANPFFFDRAEKKSTHEKLHGYDKYCF